MLKALCALNGASGDENAVRAFIIEQIKEYAQYEVDALGSLLVYKKGKDRPKKRIMLAAHMDEVAFIITSVTEDGYLHFKPVGGIDPHVVLNRPVCMHKISGVIGTKAVHQLTAEEKKQMPAFDDLTIDIGAADRNEALCYVQPGDYAYFQNAYTEFGHGFIRSKALDDRIGCMLLIKLIQSELAYDITFCFHVQEEVGLRGAACTAYAVQADIALVLETTTAADLDGVSGGQRVCVLGEGPVVGFMDSRTVYDRALYQLAFDTASEQNISIQTKTAVAGGNDAGAIQSAGKGCRVLAISVPCRYIHSGSSVVHSKDIDDAQRLVRALLEKLA